MTSIESDGWQLVSAEERHAQHPTTFEIPRVEARKSLRPGDAAKLLFDIQIRRGKSWPMIKNPEYSQTEGRHELFAAKRAEWRPRGPKTAPPALSLL